jgi:hypothetical protein
MPRACLINVEHKSGLQRPTGDSIMSLHLESSHLVVMVALALSIALLLAVKFRPATWHGIVCEALIANVSAIAAILAFEMLTT